MIAKELEGYTPKGETRLISLELLSEMLDEQEAQDNVRDVTVFEISLRADCDEGGFNWWASARGSEYWSVELEFI